MPSTDEILVKLSALARYEIRHAQLHPSGASVSDLPSYLGTTVSFDPHSDMQIDPPDGAATHAIFRITPGNGQQRIALNPEAAARVLVDVWKKQLMSLRVDSGAQYAEVVRIIEREYPRAVEALGIASLPTRAHLPATSASGRASPWGCVALIFAVVALIAAIAFVGNLAQGGGSNNANSPNANISDDAATMTAAASLQAAATQTATARCANAPASVTPAFASNEISHYMTPDNGFTGDTFDRIIGIKPSSNHDCAATACVSYIERYWSVIDGQYHNQTYLAKFDVVYSPDQNTWSVAEIGIVDSCSG